MEESNAAQSIPDRRIGPHGEWLVRHGEFVTVGLTRDAVDQLGPLVHIQLPAANVMLTRNSVAVVVESCKAAIDCLCPISGRVLAANVALFDNPGLLNESPEETWIYRLDKITDEEWQALPKGLERNRSSDR
jgi:glycine cleavage system H protein